MGKMKKQLELFENTPITFDELSNKVIEWAYDKGILEKENAPKQMLKVLEEVGETAGALLKNREEEIKDGIGDSFVTLIILAGQLGLTPEECLEAAYNEIKGRTGTLKDGVFVKDE
jgi:NTP pyrophosphatase (non-canonical NTP hydrolase)